MRGRYRASHTVFLIQRPDRWHCHSLTCGRQAALSLWTTIQIATLAISIFSITVKHWSDGCGCSNIMESTHHWHGLRAHGQGLVLLLALGDEQPQACSLLRRHRPLPLAHLQDSSDRWFTRSRFSRGHVPRLVSWPGLWSSCSSSPS